MQAGPGGESEFTVTYSDGSYRVIQADGLVADGPWARFVRGGREVVAIPSSAVRRIDHTHRPPPPTAPGAWFRWSAGLVLAALGLGAVWIGVVDTFTGRTATARASGALLAVLGVAVAVGAEGLRRRRDGDRLNRALVGALALTALGLLLVGVQFAGRGRTALVVVWAGVAALGLTVGVRLVKAGAKPLLPKAVQGFLAASVVVGLFQFWYANEYVPTSREPGLSVKVELARAPIPDGGPPPTEIPLTADITVKNVSKSKVRFLGGRYRLYTRELVDEGQLFPVGTWLEPDQELLFTRVLSVASSETGRARVEVAIHVGKGSRFGVVRQPVVCPDLSEDLPQCAGQTRSWRIIEASLLHRLTRGDRYIRQRLGAEGLETCFSSRIGGCDDSMGALYGNSRVFATDEILL